MVSRAVFDTNIVIDRLHGHPVATALINTVDDVYVSFMTYMEARIGISEADSVSNRNFDNLFSAFTVVDVKEVGDTAIRIRRHTRNKLPDAIIHATALKVNAPLYTCDRGIRPLTFMNDIEIVYPYRSSDSPDQICNTLAIIRMAPNQAALNAALNAQRATP